MGLESSFSSSSNNSKLVATVAMVMVPILVLVVLTPGVRGAFTSTTTTTKPTRRFFAGLFAASSSGGMKELPSDVVQYSQVPKTPGSFFTADKIPRGLLQDHTTKAGTWGVIRVTTGTLEYTIQEPTRSVHEITAESKPGIIEPEVKHHVKALTDDLQFVVEFYRLPGTGPVDEKREGL